MAGSHEQARLRALADYGVLDTEPEEAFDRLTSLAADLFGAPIALISLVDAQRQWFKSRHGLAIASTPRAWSFCAHAIQMGADATLVVEDAGRDPRFADNPLVTGDPNIRFYAGAVLTGSKGRNLGTLCVIDDKPRPAPSAEDLRRLNTLARIVVDELELRRVARAGLDAGAKAKSEFLAHMSHEIRTPLTSIKGFAALLEEQPELSDSSRRYVDRLTRGADALLAVVNAVLDYAKLEAGRIELRRQALSPRALVREVAQLFEAELVAKGLSLDVDCDPDAPAAVLGDADRLRQVLLNVIGNAVKFTRAGGVAIRLRQPKAGRLRFEVADTGVGVSPEGQARLFERFSQVDRSDEHVKGGAGLGLAICKGLVEQMGGRVGVKSRLGKGSRFWFEIPAEPVSVYAPAPAEIGDCAVPPGVRVLAVDDNPANRELVAAILGAFDVDLALAEGGRAAIEQAARAPYDLILMDIRMPEVDGLAAAAQIRANGGPNADIPILAFTAEVDPQALASLKQAGFDDHLTKPINPAELVRAVARWSTPRDFGAGEGLRHG